MRPSTISKGIRDLKKQSRVLQQTIENDEHIGGAIRDLKSALRGDEMPRPARPSQAPEPPKVPEDAVENQIRRRRRRRARPRPPSRRRPRRRRERRAARRREGRRPRHEPRRATPTRDGRRGRPGEARRRPTPSRSPTTLAALIKPAAGTVAKS